MDADSERAGTLFWVDCMIYEDLVCVSEKLIEVVTRESVTQRRFKTEEELLIPSGRHPMGFIYPSGVPRFCLVVSRTEDGAELKIQTEDCNENIIRFRENGEIRSLRCNGDVGQLRMLFLERLGKLNGLYYEYFPEKRPRAKVKSLKEMYAWASDNGFGNLPFFRPVNISVRNLDGKKCILMEEP